jgi:PIN domain nuclease of toxin-antitoxin system
VTERYVLDASALLCLIRNEPGADKVRAALADSSISAVNLSEVIAKMTDLGMSADLIDAVLGPLKLPTVPFDAAQARIAGLMRPKTRSLGLSLGDRACLALAEQSGVAAMTTDRAWSALEGTFKVVLAR